MKIRTLTLGISLLRRDFTSTDIIDCIFSSAIKSLTIVQEKVIQAGYEVQTLRLALNPFEDWIDFDDFTSNLIILDGILTKYNIGFCSVGSVSEPDLIKWIPDIIKFSGKFYASVSVGAPAEIGNIPVIDVRACHAAAKVMKEISHDVNDRLAGFNFCVTFNCPKNIPFFPASTHVSSHDNLLTVGLENADLLFIACHAVRDPVAARDNLVSVLYQALKPLDSLISDACTATGINYGGIDPSICPGLELPVDSVGLAIEELINTVTCDPTITPTSTAATDRFLSQYFGSHGTMRAISVITSALHMLKECKESERNDEKKVNLPFKITGYCGVMLPVMEDRILAERLLTGYGSYDNPKPTYTVKDLIAYSTVCGVGLDTVPISGDVTEDALVGVFVDLCTVAFRLNKPLSCRFIIFPNRRAGEVLQLDDLYGSPYLCPTRVFGLGTE